MQRIYVDARDVFLLFDAEYAHTAASQRLDWPGSRASASVPRDSTALAQRVCVTVSALDASVRSAMAAASTAPVTWFACVGSEGFAESA